MANEKIVTVNYKSVDEAADMAARIRAADQEGDIRVKSEGTRLEIASANPLASDLVALFRWVGRKVAGLFKGSNTVAGKKTVNA
jgi:hypothetical protein